MIIVPCLCIQDAGVNGQAYGTADRLFVAYGGTAPGKAISRQRLAHWLVDCVAWA